MNHRHRATAPATHQTRRKSSVLEVLASHLLEPQKILSSKSSLKDYSTLHTSKERIDQACLVFRRDVEEAFEEEGAPEMTSDVLKEFVIAQKALKLSQNECEELLCELASKLFNEKKGVDTFKALKVVGKTLVSYFDLVTDVMVFLELRRKNSTMAVVQGLTLGFSLFMQSLASWALGQPKLVALSGLVGFKPAIEAWRETTNAKPFPNQMGDNTFILGVSRMLEITTEAIPQAVLQSVILFLYSDQRTTVQFVSLFASMLTTGFTVAFADRDQDTSKYQRISHPKLYGYVSSTNSNKQAFFLVVFVTTYIMVKMFALSLFIATSSSASWTGGLLGLEYAGLLIWRMQWKSWRLAGKGVDGAAPALFLHLIWYICLVAAPFPGIRAPSLITPRIYFIGQLYMLTINFVIVFVCFRVFNGIDFLEETHAWLMLSTATLLCLVSGGVSFYYVPNSHRHTFYRQQTYKQYVEQFIWEEKMFVFDSNHREWTGHEAVRAFLPFFWSLRYLPKEKLIELYKDRWAIWCSDPPGWFDDDFKSMIPRELLYGVDEIFWGGGGG